MINFLRSKIDFKASRSPYESYNPDVKCARYARASASQTASKRKLDLFRTAGILISTPIPTATNPWHKYTTTPMPTTKTANKPTTSTATKSASYVR